MTKKNMKNKKCPNIFPPKKIKIPLKNTKIPLKHEFWFYCGDFAFFKGFFVYFRVDFNMIPALIEFYFLNTFRISDLIFTLF